jgi:hypothetical protein
VEAASAVKMSITDLQARIKELEAEVAALKKADSEIWYRWTKEHIDDALEAYFDEHSATSDTRLQISNHLWEKITNNGPLEAGINIPFASDFLHDELAMWIDQQISEDFPDIAAQTTGDSEDEEDQQ